MEFFQSSLFVNLIYLTLIAGIWLVAVAIIQPGTGIVEVLAAACLVVIALSTIVLELNIWALIVLAAGVLLFVVALHKEKPTVWLILSALAFIAGSIFLFWTPRRGVAVDPLLALIASVGTIAYFWFAMKSVIESQRMRPVVDPTNVVGAVGEVRTPIEPHGAVYVRGELWSARANEPLDAGQTVVVRAVDGLTLTVEPLEQEDSEEE